MKRSLALGIGVIAFAALLGTARAADAPVKQEGRVWIDTNLLLLITPNWSLTTMPGARIEYARSREGYQGLQFLELFFGPNYTHKTGNWTLKGSLWYYYMGYPQRGRNKETAAYDGTLACATAPVTGSPSTYCTSTYNASHNIEVIPSVEYRSGKWSIFDRVILHNTLYADFYSTPYNSGGTSLSVSDQRSGWGMVLRELLQVRYALTDRLGVSLADEIFVTLKEDGDTSKMKKADGSPAGYNPLGYWKSGLRYNRTYLGVDYKVTPNFTIAPMYMIELGLNPTDSGDLSDIAHTLFVVATMSTSMFDKK